MKRYYSEISIQLEVEADTLEDAEQLIHNWLITDVDSDDYIRTDVTSPLIIMEMTDGKETPTSDFQKGTPQDSDIEGTPNNDPRS